MIYIKSKYEIEQIKKACEVWKKIRQAILLEAKVGVSLKWLDNLAQKIARENECTCPFNGYNGFLGNICISVNEVVIHGVPSNYKIKDDDIITFDVGTSYNGYICDAAFTKIFGNNKQAHQINKICYESLLEGIKQVKPQNKIGDISYAVQHYVESNGYKILKDFGGHGCGKKLHEDPLILNYGKKNTGHTLLPGMVICIEPMILTDDNSYYIDSNDNWSVIAKNKKLTCHWEHMILVTENGHEILTE